MDKVQLIEFAITFIRVLRSVIVYAIIARILMSWVTMGQFKQPGRFTQVLNEITDPVLNLAKKIPHRVGMMDFSPIIAMLGIDLIAELLVILIGNLL